uniref:Uncharacterized protein n=1 Tax=Pyrodinium bahamense TaxID=73915 RepID=A0A7R9ZWZ9_9DINO
MHDSRPQTYYQPAPVPPSRSMARTFPNISRVASVLLLCSTAATSIVKEGDETCIVGSVEETALRSASLLQLNAGAVDGQAAAGGVQHAKPALAEPELGAAPQIAPFGKEDMARALENHAADTQDMLVDAVEAAEVAEIKRAVFRSLTRLRAAEIKEFDSLARLEAQSIDEYNDAHHYRGENPLTPLHDREPPVATDKYTLFHGFHR